MNFLPSFLSFYFVLSRPGCDLFFGGGYHINVKELFAVWVAVRVWGSRWCDKQIVLFSDNQDTVDIWYKGSTTEKQMMKILRKLFFFTAKHNINLILKHIPGKDNVLADLLSRFQVDKFLDTLPTADHAPALIPEDTWDA